jgi:hypothetical protein
MKLSKITYHLDINDIDQIKANAYKQGQKDTLKNLLGSIVALALVYVFALIVNFI